MTSAAGVTLSCGGDGLVDETVRDDRGSVIAPGRLAAIDLLVGDCFDGATAESAQVEAVPCSSAHDSEVVGIVTLSGGEFPGESVVERTARVRCIDVFEGYVGSHFLLSELELRFLAPTERTWERADDRDISCVAHLADGRLFETVHDSGR